MDTVISEASRAFIGLHLRQSILASQKEADLWALKIIKLLECDTKSGIGNKILVPNLEARSWGQSLDMDEILEAMFPELGGGGFRCYTRPWLCSTQGSVTQG